MAKERLPMKEIKKLFHLRFFQKLGQKQTALCIGCGKSTVFDYEQRAKKAGLETWEKIKDLSEDELLVTLGFKNINQSFLLRKKSHLPDWKYIHKELSKKHVTLALLWEEYKADHPEGYQYTQFREHYKRWEGKLSVTLRQRHKGGEKCFIDYAGTTVDILINSKTGELREAQIFVGVLGASSYTYVEATWSQSLSDFLMSHRRMFEFFGGIPQILVPDNLKSAVTTPNRYEAVVNRSYHDLSEHYGTCVIPSRVRRPQDKAKVEAGVLLASRWILAAVRNKTFTSLDELNETIEFYLEKLNNKTMRHFKKSRKELFKSLDKPVLGKLRGEPYIFSDWKKARVNIDYHIQYKDHFYSAPHNLIKQEVEVRATSQIIEIFFNSKRVASHRRSHQKGGFTTDEAHRPESHRAHLKWTPERIIKWAKSKGDNIGLFVEHLIATKQHPEQAYRAALGVIRLSEKYGSRRLNQACGNAIAIGAIRYQVVKNMLQNNMDKIDQTKKQKSKQEDFFTSNSNVRGKNYYH